LKGLKQKFLSSEQNNDSLQREWAWIYCQLGDDFFEMEEFENAA